MVLTTREKTQSASEDASLVSRCLNRDPVAWDALVEKYSRLVYSVPFKYGLDVSDADEVFQTVWVKALEKLDTLRDATKLSSWLITTASRESWQVIRGRQTARARFASVAVAEGLRDDSVLPTETIERLDALRLDRYGDG